MDIHMILHLDACRDTSIEVFWTPRTCGSVTLTLEVLELSLVFMQELHMSRW